MQLSHLTSDVALPCTMKCLLCITLQHLCTLEQQLGLLIKNGNGFPCSLLSAGPGADPGVQAVSPQAGMWSRSQRLESRGAPTSCLGLVLTENLNFLVSVSAICVSCPRLDFAKILQATFIK